MTIKIITYDDRHFAGVKALWEMCFPDDPPWNYADVSIPAKLAAQPDLLVVAIEEGVVVGSIMAGYDGHRGWLYALAVLPENRRRGIGSLLVREAERRLGLLGCKKVNLQVRTTNAAVAEFYTRLGFSTEERLSMGKRL